MQGRRKHPKTSPASLAILYYRYMDCIGLILIIYIDIPKMIFEQLYLLQIHTWENCNPSVN